jgi:putative methionine-R-sulfoxide reductase with GAF domain
MFKQKTQFEDRVYFKTTLQVVSALCLIGTGLLGFQTLAAGSLTLSAVGLFFGMLFSGAMFVLTLRNNLTLPRYLTPPVTYGIVFFLVMVGEGIFDEAILGFILVIVLAGLLIGRFWGAVYTIAGILAVSIIGFGQMYGWFPGMAEFGVQAYRIIVIDTIFVFIGAIVYVTIANLERVLEQVKEREIELENSNQALLDVQVGLEERIADRVRNLNAAREEAEAARAESEKQVWLATGLAQLGDVIRGEQEISDLASKVIQHLCIYLDAQVGAIFLLDENNILQQTGTYAISGDQQSSFELGDGIVGQAAQGKETILLRDIPAESIRISSGLSDLLPNNLVAVPFLFAEKVLGVFEIGSLHSFDPLQLQFLERATESICIAFHTAQTRAQVDRLLVQTRKQAEELQEQGEELRAINEELETQAENLRVANQALQTQAERLRSFESQGED